mmetsp:Transcript_44441/g.117968  ORF Transcript_44441/g.117968 Transcript_44441/m.117968 type:complete len:240 (-) Transcript_44441:124-843(-)
MPFVLEVDYAKSSRAACKQCKTKIDKDVVRIGLKTVSEDARSDEEGSAKAAFEAVKWHHLECLPRARGPVWFKKNFPEESTAIEGLSALKASDLSAVQAVLAECRGAGQVAGKRKSGAVPESPSKAARIEGLTAQQSAAVNAARAEMAPKSTAALGALLGKNGMPKTGRKDELVERAAECKALGVPPVCPRCEKVKLKWMKGKFSCPGYFDTEAGMPKRCKGPEGGAEVQRTPWDDQLL